MAKKSKEWGKFKFKGEEYDLLELVKQSVISENDFYILDESGNELGIIKKTGIERLQDHFGVVVVEVGSIQPIKYNGIDLLTLQLAVSDKDNIAAGLPPMWEMSEVSPENLAGGISNDYPVSMLWKRTLGRAVRRYIGLVDWYTQDEFKELSENVQKLNDNTNEPNKPNKPSEDKKDHDDAEEAKVLSEDPHEDWSISEYAKQCAFLAKEMGYTQDKYINRLRSLLGLGKTVSFMPDRIPRAKWISVYSKFKEEEEKAEKAMKE